MSITVLDAELSELICEMFDYSGEVRPGMGRADFVKWDSLKHVQLVEALESKYGIQLGMDEMIEMRSIDDIVKVLARHGV